MKTQVGMTITIQTSNTQINFKIHADKKSDRFTIHQPTEIKYFSNMETGNNYGGNL